MTKTVEIVDTELSRLGPGDLDSEDSDDVSAWLSCSLAVRLTNQLSKSNKASTKFTLHLAFQVIKRVLNITEEGWSNDIQKLLDVLSLAQNRVSTTMRWHALASSYLALCTLLQQQEKFSEHSAKCLAIVDLSQSCLHAGLVLFDDRLVCRNSKDDKDGDIENIENENEEDQIAFESNALHNLFVMFETKAQDIERLSQKLALTHPHLRRVNFQVTCMRQFFRIQKSLFKTNNRESSVAQSTLKDFFTLKDSV